MNRPLRLLLVEDNPADAMLVQVGLKNTNGDYKLEVASDAEEAIALLMQMPTNGYHARPDLILLDLNLPKISGHELLQMIKAHVDLKVIPVIILSSSHSRSDVVAAYRHGANSYLQKPYSIEETFDLMGILHRYWLDFALLPVYSADAAPAI